MQDEHAGNAGTFVVDPDQGIRVPLEQYQVDQAAKSQAEKAPLKKTPTEESN